VRFLFGDVTFDCDARQLLRGGREIHLSPKAFQLLRILVEHRPRVLSKNELHEHLWPATFVSEANLASLIGEIREALGDAAREPRFVRTAHRIGYAFNGDAIEDRSGGVPLRPADRDRVPTICWLIKDRKRIPLAAGENILGREPDNGIVRIDSPTVSRRHARISISRNGAVLEDLGSKNGTFLRGEPLSGAASLSDGDEIRVGSIVVRFRVSSASTSTWSDRD
jgi:DNA-binding winged helix-turn-helix (wHTH) protein